jgi:hypothetical protein
MFSIFVVQLNGVVGYDFDDGRICFTSLIDQVGPILFLR